MPCPVPSPATAPRRNARSGSAKPGPSSVTSSASQPSCSGAQRHGSLAVVPGVGDQHVHHLADDGARGAGADGVCGQPHTKGPALRGQRAAPARLRVVEQGAQVGDRAAPVGVARHREQRVDRRAEPVDLSERGRDLLGCLAAELDGLQLDAQRLERGAQLVRGVGAEGSLPAEQVVEPAAVASARRPPRPAPGCPFARRAPRSRRRPAAGRRPPLARAAAPAGGRAAARPRSPRR